MRKINSLWLGLEESDLAAGIFIALLEGEEGGGGLALEAEGGGDFGPLDFEGGASLQGGGCQWISGGIIGNSSCGVGLTTGVDMAGR